jgi:hypothetical protein
MKTGDMKAQSLTWYSKQPTIVFFPAPLRPRTAIVFSAMATILAVSRAWKGLQENVPRKDWMARFRNTIVPAARMQGSGTAGD